MRPCPHTPQCSPADSSAPGCARVIAAHPEQGWSLLCNGTVHFYDGIDLLPDLSVDAVASGGRVLAHVS